MIRFKCIYKYPTYDEYQRIKKFKERQKNISHNKKNNISYQDYLNNLSIIKRREPCKNPPEPCIGNPNNQKYLNFKC